MFLEHAQIFIWTTQLWSKQLKRQKFQFEGKSFYNSQPTKKKFDNLIFLSSFCQMISSPCFQDKLDIYNHFYSNLRGVMKGKKKGGYKMIKHIMKIIKEMKRTMKKMYKIKIRIQCFMSIFP